jgi:hypothetical protein
MNSYGIHTSYAHSIILITEIYNYGILLYFFLLAIVLSVLLRFTDSDYPFGIFKLFLLRNDKYTCRITAILKVQILIVTIQSEF